MHLRVTAITSITKSEPVKQRAGTDDTYGFALEAHPGKSQGRPTTNTASRATE